MSEKDGASETIDRDLPDPQPRKKLGEENERLIRFHVFRNLFIFSAFYGCLHKVIVPLFLLQTKVLVRDYTRVDYWAIPGFLLAVYLIRFKKLDPWASLLAGMIVVYAAWDTHAIFSGEHQGWLVWSHALSSLPQGFMAIALLSTTPTPQFRPKAWIGAGLALAFLIFTPHHTPYLLAPETPSAHSSSLLPKAQREDCGLSEFQMHRLQFQHSQTVQIKACGFAPVGMIISSNNELFVERLRPGTLNLHVEYFNMQGLRRRQSNRVFMDSDQKLSLKPFAFASDEVAAVVYSDSDPHAGKVLILNPKNKEDFEFAGITKSRKLVWKSP